MRLAGFDVTEHAFLIIISSTVPAAEDTLVKRKYEDFLRLNRTLRKVRNDDGSMQQQPRDGMPLKQLKQLSTGSWTLHGENWKIEYLKSVQCINSWLLMCSQSVGGSGILTGFFDEGMHETLQRTQLFNQTQSRHSKHFQQYFSTKLNHDILLRLGLEGVDVDSNALVIEPSCGDGRLLREIISRGYAAIGCEIDEVVASKVRGNFGMDCPVIVDDFTQTKLSFFLQEFKRISSLKAASSVLLDPDVNIIVIGCPPYTYTPQCFRSKDTVSPPVMTNYGAINSKECIELESEHAAPEKNDYHSYPTVGLSSAAVVGLGEDKKPDAIIAFLCHSAHELRASKIVFLLPARCGLPEFVARALHALNDIHSTSQQKQLRCEVTESCNTTALQGIFSGLDYTWNLSQTEECDSNFEVAGRTVKQPSIIQMYTRIPVSDP